MTVNKPTPFQTLAGELRARIDHDARTNEMFEEFIARCRPEDVGSLPLVLANHHRATAQLVEIYELIRALEDKEARVRAMAVARHRRWWPGALLSGFGRRLFGRRLKEEPKR